MIKNYLTVVLIASFLFPLYASAVFIPGADGGSLKANTGANEPTSQITMMGWMYATTTSLSKVMLWATSTGAFQNDMFIRYQVAPTNAIRCQINAGGSITTLSDPNNTWSHWGWKFIACVYDGATIQLYRNGGVPGASTAKTGTIPQLANWQIGAGGLTGFLPMHGWISDVWIFNRALTAQEIKNYYYFGAINRTGCVHHWALDINGRDDCGRSTATSTTANIIYNGYRPYTKSLLRR